MAYNIAPTKANLLKAKSMLQFSVRGYNLLDKKRNVLIREMMGLVGQANALQVEIQQVYKEAYDGLMVANITIGKNHVEEISISVPKSEEYEILLQSVMGVEIPRIKHAPLELSPAFGLFRTNASLDVALEKFTKLRELLYRLAEMETSVYKLAMEIKKTQKRTNALERIQIPKYKEIVKSIQETLEEKEREDFARLKKLKKKSAEKAAREKQKALLEKEEALKRASNQ